MNAAAPEKGNMRRHLRRFLTIHWLLTVFIMGLAGLAFGILTYSLFDLLRANFALVAEHGWMALMDGAALQLLGLVIYGYLGILAYIVLKACEKVLVDKLLR